MKYTVLSAGNEDGHGKELPAGTGYATYVASITNRELSPRKYRIICSEDKTEVQLYKTDNLVEVNRSLHART